jgi:hypothetical protein
LSGVVGPIPLNENVLCDALQHSLHLAPLRTAFDSRGFRQPGSEPVDHPGAGGVHLASPGRREPEPFATALGVTGGDEAVETWLENLARHPNMLGDVAEAGLTGSLHETVHLKQCPQTTDVERAVRPAR